MAWHQPPPLRQPLKFEVFSEDSLLLLLSILCIFVLNLTLQSYLNTRLLFLYLVKYSWNSFVESVYTSNQTITMPSTRALQASAAVMALLSLGHTV